ncbi:MAG TPA: hypothetical protein VHB48_00490 [Chitinophagaceae bacterium]|jgi:hypothetical protein|nr:hypothetical protein [Chitinophagaceae bacterium]
MQKKLFCTLLLFITYAFAQDNDDCKPASIESEAYHEYWLVPMTINPPVYEQGKYVCLVQQSGLQGGKA